MGMLFTEFWVPNDCYWHVVWYLVYDVSLLLEKYFCFYQLSEPYSDWNFALRVYVTILRHIIYNTMNGQTLIKSNGWICFFIIVINSRIICEYVNPDMQWVRKCILLKYMNLTFVYGVLLCGLFRKCQWAGF